VTEALTKGLTEIVESHIDAIAIGATVLGTGGGGDPLVGSLIAKRKIREHGPVQVVGTEELSDDDVIAPIGMIGAPSVSLEKISAANELDQAMGLIEDALGKQLSAIMPIEIGGGNSLLPIAAAASKGVPIVDADAMGRAFPEAQMVTFHLEGYGPGTTALVDVQGNGVITRPTSGAWSERLARVTSFEMGGSATMIDYVHSGAVVRKCAIPGTLSLAHSIGEILLSPELRDEQRLSTITDTLGGFQLFTGKVTELDRSVRGGFTRGLAQLTGISDDKDSQMSLYFQNEMLLATRGDQLAAVTPDLIAVLDTATGQPITTEALRYGARVSVVAFPCNPRWRTQAGLETAGPKYFGYDVDFVPVEQLVSDTNAPSA
jgi:DUF917 family protein